MRNLLTFLLVIPFIIFADSDCQPSIWGPDDEIGAANMISNENTLEAVKLIKKGMSHGLGIVIEPGMPAFDEEIFGPVFSIIQANNDKEAIFYIYNISIVNG